MGLPVNDGSRKGLSTILRLVSNLGLLSPGMDRPLFIGRVVLPSRAIISAREDGGPESLECAHVVEKAGPAS